MSPDEPTTPDPKPEETGDTLHGAHAPTESAHQHEQGEQPAEPSDPQKPVGSEPSA